MLKMSSKEKVYRGSLYSFTKKKHLNSGGNGAVFDVKIKGLKEPFVAKFFKYSGKSKKRRYERFKREISFLSNFKGVDGVIEIIDKYCPNNLSKKQNEAWYIMPKAEVYRVNSRESFSEKLNDMISLARILEMLHSKKYAHRDIKPENILLLNGKVVLADFGLAWNPNMERLTVSNERVGPYRILPPELEHIDDSANIDYRFSDVYLFAKVLWMTLKVDNNGFRGPYDRGDDKIYLSKSIDDACTLEPIHNLLEESTCDDISKRITITDCIKHLEYQKLIAINPESIDPLELQKLQYEENSRRMIAKNKPDEVVYSDEKSLLNVLQEIAKNIISNSAINITETDTDMNHRIQISEFSPDLSGVCHFELFVNRTKVKEYMAQVVRVIYHKKNEIYTLELGELDEDISEYISFGESLTGFNVNAPKIYLSPKEKIIISKPC